MNQSSRNEPSAPAYLVTHAGGGHYPNVPPELTRSIKQLQSLTLGWMLIECCLTLGSAWKAHSFALMAFGSDSFVELLSGLIVLLQFTSIIRISTEWAARITGTLLFILMSVIVIGVASALVFHVRSDTSKLGMGVTILALLIMPILSRAKKRMAKVTGNRALAADAMQSATCAYLAAVTLLGLLLNAGLHIYWIDPAAALAALPFLWIEARRALRGESCC